MKRFIAGAVCPQCRAVDRIVLEEEPPPSPGGEAVQRRRCVSCGYVDTMAVSTVAEPSSRFSRRPGRAEQASPVRIIDPAKPQS